MEDTEGLIIKSGFVLNAWNNLTYNYASVKDYWNYKWQRGLSNWFRGIQIAITFLKHVINNYFAVVAHKQYVHHTRKNLNVSIDH